MLVVNCAKPEPNRIHPSPAPPFARPAVTHVQASRRAVMIGGALLAIGALGRRQAQAATARSRHRDARRAGVAGKFYPSNLCRSGAQKGGRLLQGVLGTFDSLNPFIVNGLAAVNIRGYVIESLLSRGYDEPFTLYGLLARGVETDDARSYVTFEIDPAARFSDGQPVTPADVIFSWELLRDKGRPNYRTYYIKVVKAEATGERSVRFDLTGADDRELPLILGLMPVLPKHAINPDTFENTTFAPPLGSGPYIVTTVKAGRKRHLQAQSGLLGPRSANQSRPVEFRRNPFRLLSRR